MGISLPLYLDWGNPIRDIEIKKRYAYLVNWKRRKFHNYTQGWHSGSHAIAWAAITTFVCTGFLRPPIQNVAFAVPRFCVNNGSIGTKRAIGITGNEAKVYNLYLSIAAMIALMTSCASGKIVLSNNANISKYKYVIFGKETSGDRELDDVVMSVQNQIAETNLTVLSPSNTLKILECSDSILSPNIHVTSEKWDGGHTYITVTFYDYNTNQSVAVIKSSGIGMTVSHDQNIALSAIRKKLNKLFK